MQIKYPESLHASTFALITCPQERSILPRLSGFNALRGFLITTSLSLFCIRRERRSKSVGNKISKIRATEGHLSLSLPLFRRVVYFPWLSPGALFPSPSTSLIYH